MQALNPLPAQIPTDEGSQEPARRILGEFAPYVAPFPAHRSVTAPLHETDVMQNRFHARTGQTTPTTSAHSLADDADCAARGDIDTRIEDTLTAARALAELGVIEPTESIDPVDSDGEPVCAPYFPLVDDQRRYLEQAAVGAQIVHPQKSPASQATKDIQAWAAALEEQRIEPDRKAKEAAFRTLFGREPRP